METLWSNGPVYRGIRLKPCPFCGEAKALSVCLHEDPSVKCGRCFATSYAMATDYKNGRPSMRGAVRRWNTRATP